MAYITALLRQYHGLLVTLTFLSLSVEATEAVMQNNVALLLPQGQFNHSPEAFQYPAVYFCKTG